MGGPFNGLELKPDHLQAGSRGSDTSSWARSRCRLVIISGIADRRASAALQTRGSGSHSGGSNLQVDTTKGLVGVQCSPRVSARPLRDAG